MDVGRERTPALHAEVIAGNRPNQHHLRLAKERARRHALGEPEVAEVERNAGAQHRRGVGTAHRDRDVSVSHRDQRMMAIGEPRLQRFERRLAVAFGLDEEPFVRAKPGREAIRYRPARS